MFRIKSPAKRGSAQYRGTALLASGTRRLARVVPAILFLWVLVAWAMSEG